MANPNPTKPDKIIFIGLKKYLDDTAVRHRGIDYNDFVMLITNENKAEVARLMDVSRTSVYAWIKIYELEKDT